MRAIDIARDAQTALPADPAPPRALANLFRLLEDYRLAADAATHWADRAGWARPIAEKFLAGCLADYGLQNALAGKRPLEGLDTTDLGARPHVAHRALVRVARGLASRGRTEEARQLLTRLANTPAVEAAADTTPILEATPVLRIEGALAWLALRDATEDRSYEDKARALLHAAREDDATLAHGLITVGMIYDELLGDVKSSEAAYRLTLERHPDNYVALNNLADLLLRTDRAGDALQYAEHAARVGGLHAIIWETLADVRMDLGDKQGAREAMQKCVENARGVDEDQLEAWQKRLKELSKG